MLDTNTVSYLIRAHPVVTEKVVQIPMHSLCISAITEAELLFGLAKRPDAKRLHTAVRELLSRLDVVSWDRTASEHYAVTRAALESRGQVLAPLDMLIAAQAIASDSVLVTSDKAFRQITELQTQDWMLEN